MSLYSTVQWCLQYSAVHSAALGQWELLIVTTFCVLSLFCKDLYQLKKKNLVIFLANSLYTFSVKKLAVQANQHLEGLCSQHSSIPLEIPWSRYSSSEESLLQLFLLHFYGLVVCNKVKQRERGMFPFHSAVSHTDLQRLYKIRCFSLYLKLLKHLSRYILMTKSNCNK